MPPPTRATLEAMKRADLQKLCKEYGVRANLKTEALIEMLLDAQSPLPRARPPSTPPVRDATIRLSSMIIHDLPETEAGQGVVGGVPSPQMNSLPIVPPPRTRKAKETQYRLGIGKPVVAGGQGPRAVTRSRSISKSKRLRGSRALNPETMIVEEEAEIPEVPTSSLGKSPKPAEQKAIPSTVAPHSKSTHSDEISISKEVLEVYVKNELVPLYEQIQTLKAELEQMQSLQAEIHRLKAQIVEIDVLRETVTELRAQVQGLHPAGGSSSPDEEIVQVENPTTPKPNSRSKTLGLGGLGIWGALQSSKVGASEEPVRAPRLSQATTQSLLGKRQREATPVNSIPEASTSKTGDRLKIPQPKKRAKVSLDVGSSVERDKDTPNTSVNRASSFKVFTGTDGVDSDEPPPSSLPPIYEDSPPAGGSNPRPTSTANAPENQNPFNFPFLPIESTPVPVFLPNFPYPEPPHTPTPDRKSGGHDEGALFTLPTRHRTSAPPGSDSESGFVNPESLTRRPSNEKGKGPGFSFGFNPSSSSTTVASAGDEPPPIKRTMYGTEMDGDTRFGDFGVDGIAGGFWTGGRF
ncbi:hypothetical protein AX16_009645 [Volvariella volvacea WC 439]|nr:hypothetical protein AX16_009645 [Volvariella volvacea WC 439]